MARLTKARAQISSEFDDERQVAPDSSGRVAALRRLHLLGVDHSRGPPVRVRGREARPSFGRRLRCDARIEIAMDRRRRRKTTGNRPPLASGVEHVPDRVDHLPKVGLAGRPLFAGRGGDIRSKAVLHP